ncbi:hypothetical protein C8J56DRAFT_1046170 [Mycena floridula]|nr:hypothetical protein C8J56DRAFT_1046170 [Mycena floridula]
MHTWKTVGRSLVKDFQLVEQLDKDYGILNHWIIRDIEADPVDETTIDDSSDEGSQMTWERELMHNINTTLKAMGTDYYSEASEEECNAPGPSIAAITVEDALLIPKQAPAETVRVPELIDLDPETHVQKLRWVAKQFGSIWNSQNSFNKVEIRLHDNLPNIEVKWPYSNPEKYWDYQYLMDAEKLLQSLVAQSFRRIQLEQYWEERRTRENQGLDLVDQQQIPEGEQDNPETHIEHLTWRLKELARAITKSWNTQVDATPIILQATKDWSQMMIEWDIERNRPKILAPLISPRDRRRFGALIFRLNREIIGMERAWYIKFETFNRPSELAQPTKFTHIWNSKPRQSTVNVKVDLEHGRVDYVQDTDIILGNETTRGISAMKEMDEVIFEAAEAVFRKDSGKDFIEIKQPTDEDAVKNTNIKVKDIILTATKAILGENTMATLSMSLDTTRENVMFQWWPLPVIQQTTDPKEPAEHYKIHQWKQESKGRRFYSWKSIKEKVQQQLQGKAFTSENTQSPIIIWDERDYLGILEGKRVYLVPHGKFDLTISSLAIEDMRDHRNQYLEKVQVMVDGQTIFMDFETAPITEYPGDFKTMEG